jgi:hypothetical protein
MIAGLFPFYTVCRDAKSGMTVLLASDGRRLGFALDVPMPKPDDQMPALNFGAIEITTKFDSEDIRTIEWLAMDLLRKRVNSVALGDPFVACGV